MHIHIPSSQSHRVVSLLQALGGQFPEVARELIEIAHKARDGITIEILPYAHKRSRQQENYYRKWCRAFGEYCGTTPDETHEEILCIAYGSEVRETRFGRKIRPVQRSSEANRIEYSLLIDTLVRVAAEMGFDIPPPQRQMDD